MTLAQYLREHRISQTDFAGMVGISEPSLSRILHGLQRPSLTVLQAIERLTEQRVLPSDFPPEPTSQPNEAAE